MKVVDQRLSVRSERHPSLSLEILMTLPIVNNVAVLVTGAVIFVLGGL